MRISAANMIWNFPEHRSRAIRTEEIRLFGLSILRLLLHLFLNFRSRNIKLPFLFKIRHSVPDSSNWFRLLDRVETFGYFLIISERVGKT